MPLPVGAIEIDFDVQDAPELAEHLESAADGFRRAT